MHGGVIATLLDTAAGLRGAQHAAGRRGLHLAGPDHQVPAPGQLDSGLLRCEGTVISRGRRIALAQAQLTDDRGRLVAHATSSCLIFDL